MGWPYDPQKEVLCPACDGDGCRHCGKSGIARDLDDAKRIRKEVRDEWYEDHGPDDPPEVDESRLP